MGRAERADRAGEGRGLSRPDPATLWGVGDYERLAERFAPIHTQLVERLGPAAGVRWLDVATGTGGVALLAAAAGADVEGVDIAPAMIAAAQEKASAVRFEVADCESLPYGDASFEVVSSCFGFIFAADQAATARELARVTRRRLGFTAWSPNRELQELYAAFDLDAPEGRLPFDWGRPARVHELLGEAFSLEIEPHVWHLEGASGGELWELWSESAPPFKAMVDGLDPGRRKEFRSAYVAYCERYRNGDRLRVPRAYLLVLGRRR